MSSLRPYCRARSDAVPPLLLLSFDTNRLENPLLLASVLCHGNRDETRILANPANPRHLYRQRAVELPASEGEVRDGLGVQRVVDRDSSFERSAELRSTRLGEGVEVGTDRGGGEGRAELGR